MPSARTGPWLSDDLTHWPLTVTRDVALDAYIRRGHALIGPDDRETRRRALWAFGTRDGGELSVPSTIALLRVTIGYTAPFNCLLTHHYPFTYYYPISLPSAFSHYSPPPFLYFPYLT